MCMQRGEVIRRLEAGETASMIAKRQWNRMLNGVNRWNTENNESLVTAINNILKMLDKANVIELGDCI